MTRATEAAGWAGAVGFFVLLYRCFDVEGHLPAHNDPTGYLLDAKRFYSDISLGGLQGGGRPIFSWPLLLVFRAFGVDPSYNTLCLANSFFSLGTLLLGLIGLGLACGVGLSSALFAFSMTSAMACVLELSSGFWGDLTAGAVCVGLAASASALSSPRPSLPCADSRKHLFAFAVLVFAAVNTKPVCLLWAVVLLIALGLLAVWNRSLPARLSGRALGAYALALLLLVWGAWPRNLTKLLRDLYFQNEVLDSFIIFPGLHGRLWFFLELLLNLSLPMLLVALAFSVSLSVCLVSALRRGPMSSLRSAARHPLAAVWLGWLAMLGYSSLVMKSSDARRLFFLFPLFYFLVSATLSLILDTRKARLAFACGSIAAMLAGLGAHGPLTPNAALSRMLGARPPRVMEVPFPTVESSGAALALRSIRSDLDEHPAPGNHTVLLLEQHPVVNQDVIEKPSYSMSPLSRMTYSDIRVATYHSRLGDWGHPGGIPAEFFTFRHLIYCRGGACWAPPASRKIADELRKGNPAYWDGLTRVARVMTKAGVIEILRRERSPKPASKLRVIQELAQADPENLWNYPFVEEAARMREAKEDLRDLEKRMRAALHARELPAYLGQSRRRDYDFSWIDKIRSR